MKLRNKKTGEIEEFEDITRVFKFIGNQNTYSSLAELNAEWEDAQEESKDNNYWYIDSFGRVHFSSEVLDEIEGRPNNWMARKLFGNYFSSREESERAVEKLKAWKRLKDKGFRFHGHNALGVGEITFSLDFEDMDDEGEIGQLRHDLDLLFGGEE